MPWQPVFASFGEFLAALFHALGEHGVRPLVLRNYEGFPDVNLGSDLDLLILPSQLGRAMQALQSIPGIRIAGYLERRYVVNVYLEGVSPEPGTRALHLDFNLLLSWKDVPYLPTEIVLDAAIPKQAGDLNFLAPSPVHEAIVSLLGTLLVGGRIKEKYLSQVRQTFSADRSGTIAALLPQFGIQLASQLVDAVIADDRPKVLSMIGALRRSLVMRGLLRRPLRTALAYARHYSRELAVRHSPMTLETVCICAPPGKGKAALGSIEVIDTLEPLLRYTAQVIQKLESGLEADLRGLSREWRERIAGKAVLTLRLLAFTPRESHIDPVWICSGGPRWLVILFSKLMPAPDLILDASQSSTDGIEKAYEAIVKMLEQRTSQQLKRRFAHRVAERTARP